jgi:hypothetical protein
LRPSLGLFGLKMHTLPSPVKFSIIQTNDSYMPVQDTSLEAVLTLRAKIGAPVR